MTAQYMVARSVTTDKPSFIVVADNNKVAYILPEKAAEKRLNERIEMLVETQGEKPDNTVDWLGLAVKNMSYIATDMPLRAKTFNEAVKLARKMWKEGFTDADPARSNRMTALAEAHDDWFEDHEDVWSDEDYKTSRKNGDYNVWHPDISQTPDDELEFQHAVAGAVNPEEPHMWLPPSVEAEECAYCDKMRDDPLHPVGNTMPGNVIVTEEE
jgi:hypothetical protein